MADKFIYNPFDRYYRSSHGAIAEGTSILFRVKMIRTGFVSANMVFIYDDSGEQKHEQMVWKELKGGYDIYELTFDTSGYKGLIWYYFEAVKSSGTTMFFGENTSGGKLSAEIPAAFQLTVFDGNILIPRWYSQGVTYHVFVDRFFRSEKSEVLFDDPDFMVHVNKNETPEYLPDEHGEILNRDIYGGNLKGIEEKLDYLESLGVTTLYLSPVFEAWSNHKYNTADYKKIDAHFGNEKDMESLCLAAKKKGIRVILDGVFNHTGSDSLYFNRNGRYPTLGAYQSEDSDYRNWYCFDNSPHGYQSWWGISTLPAVNEMDKSYRDFIMGDDNCVVKHWMNIGISGWRLDVADELPDEFLIQFNAKVRECNKEAIVIGEVWEDASNKIAYDVRRKYFVNPELDGVMNYPIKEGILSFLNYHISSRDLKFSLDKLLDHYPEQVQNCLMNLIGTHDTIRAINALACPNLVNESRCFKAEHSMDEKMRAYGKKRLMMASCLQYFFPGSPSVYYGDETAMEGFEDPFNRRFYPWENQDVEMIEHYRRLGRLKKNCDALHYGKFKIECVNDDCIVFMRNTLFENVFCVINRGEKQCLYEFPEFGTWTEIFSENVYESNSENNAAEIQPDSFSVWIHN